MVDTQKGEATANEPTAHPALASGGSPAGSRDLSQRVDKEAPTRAELLGLV